MLVLVHLYYVPALSGILYPGALWMDPEFGDGGPQKKGFTGKLLLLGVRGGWSSGNLRGQRARVSSKSGELSGAR